MKTFTLFFCLCALTISGFTQGYNITFRLKGAAHQPIELAYYYGDKQYLQARDTTDLAGNVVFSGKIALQPGIYMLIMPGLNIRFDLLIDDKQNFEISSTTENLIDKMKVKGSRCNAVFFEFQKQMAVLNPKIAELASQRDTLMKHNADSVSIQKIQKEVDILDDQA